MFINHGKTDKIKVEMKAFKTFFDMVQIMELSWPRIFWDTFGNIMT
jgi:hypothetical protein